MKTELVRAEEADGIERAAGVIRSGGLCAFPTETVYGLGADALDERAVQKIFASKGRPADKALIIHICRAEQMEEVAVDIPQSAYALAEEFWPGPLTLVLRKRDTVPGVTSGGKKTIGVRMPDNETARRLIDASGRLIAAPSANLSGKASPKSAGDVLDQLAGRIDMVLDGGETSVGVESTIIDLTASAPRILRQGALAEEEIFRVLRRA